MAYPMLTGCLKQPRLAAMVLVAGLLLGGCASGQYPTASLKADLADSAVIARDYAVQPEWWTVYGDAQLNRLVDTALANNLDLAKSAIKVRQALYQANLAGANLVPTVSGSLNGSARQNLKDGGASVRSVGAQLGVSYELDLWRKLADSADAQVWEYQATQEDKEAAKLALVNSVVDAYYHLAYLQAAQRLTQQSIDHYREMGRIAQSQYRYGKVSSLLPAQAQQSLLGAQNNLLALQSEQLATEQTLRNLLNLRPADALAIRVPDLTHMSLPSVDLDVPLAVLANRPDIRAAEYRLQKMFKNQQATEKSWYPSISLGASLSASSDKVRTVFDVPFTAGTVSVNLPFLQWHTVKWNIKTSQAAFETAKLDFQQSLTTALNEVSHNYAQYAQSERLLHNLEQKYRADEKVSQYYRSRYRLGAAPLGDWLDAQNSALNARQTWLNQRYQVLKQQNMLYKSMAGRYRRAVTSDGL